LKLVLGLQFAGFTPDNLVAPELSLGENNDKR